MSTISGRGACENRGGVKEKGDDAMLRDNRKRDKFALEQMERLAPYT